GTDQGSGSSRSVGSRARTLRAGTFRDVQWEHPANRMADESVNPRTAPERLAELALHPNASIASHALRNSSLPLSAVPLSALLHAGIHTWHARTDDPGRGWQDRIVSELSRTGSAARHEACPPDVLGVAAAAVHEVICRFDTQAGSDWALKMAPA